MRWKLLILSLFISVTVNGQGGGCIPTRSEYPFRDGERITLSLMYKWGAVNTEVGQAFVDLDSLRFNGEPAFHVNFRVKSAPFFDLFFKMREDFHSWMTIKDLKPVKFTRDTYEGGYTATNDYNYDWPNNVIHADVNFNNRGEEHYEIPLHECAYDLPALIYYLRTMDLSRMNAGEKYDLSFAIDDTVFDIILTYRGREKINVRKMGKRNALLFTCSVVSGAMFEGDQEVKFWFSDDGYYVPLAVMAPLRVGACWCWLKDFKP